MTNYGLIAGGIAVGAIGVLFTTPLPAARGDCAVYSVAHKVATSYVLRPPPSPPADPVIVKEKCPAPSVSPKAENDTQPDLNATDDTQKPRRHRRHRVRRYWR